MDELFYYRLGKKRGGGGEVLLQDKTITENGEYTADAGYDGLGKVTVDVAGSGGIAAGISYDEFDSKGYLIKATMYGTQVAPYAFYNAINLTSVTIPDNVSKIGASAFQSCAQLLLDHLPSALSELETNAFYGCNKIAPQSLPTAITNIPYGCFTSCNKISWTSLHEGITSIGANAFSSCTTLAITSLPASLTDIGSGAFNNTRFTSLTFKSKPTSLANDTFRNNVSLTVINVPWAEGEVANAPWGATKATINYNYTGA